MTRLDISRDSSAKTIHMKCHAYFLMGNTKKIKVSSKRFTG